MSFAPITPIKNLPGSFINTPAVPRPMPSSHSSSSLGSGGASVPSDPFTRSVSASSLYPDLSKSIPKKRSPLGSTVTVPSPSHSTPPAHSFANLPTTPSSGNPFPMSDATGRALEAPASPATKAAATINQFLRSDQEFPDIDSYCRQVASSDYDFSYLESSWEPFHKTQMYPIPEQIFNHYNSSKLQTMMGLFAEINHAWVVIDNAIYLWDYTNPNPELEGFEDPAHTIQAVALVPPKPGIFVKTISHILVVATSNEIILLGVSSEQTAAGTKSISLYQTKMSLPIRGHDVHIITSSADGRIFFGGSVDTDVYELYYQPEERWFSNRCGKINHSNPGWTSVLALQGGLFSTKESEHLVDMVVDDTRCLLYTLSSTSTIRMYHMEGPNRLTKVIEKTKNHCLRDITHMITASSLLTGHVEIVSISPIPYTEAAKLHLMALTSTGCRLFFSATNAASFMGSQAAANLAPQSMQVQFIKFPPSVHKRTATTPSGHDVFVDVESRALTRSRKGARFPPGYFLDFVAKDGSSGEDDVLFISAPESGRIKNSTSLTTLRYYEHGNWIELGGKAEAVGLITKPFGATRTPAGFGNELAVQFDEPSSQFAVLTNTGIHVIRRRRLVEIFASAIRSCVGDEGLEGETSKFIQLYGRIETISSALAVACGQGIDPHATHSRAVDQHTEDRARTVFVDHGGRPSLTDPEGLPLNTSSVRLSSRHDAIALYVSRLVRKMWKSHVIQVAKAPSGGLTITSPIPTEKLLVVQANVERLRRFLDANRAFILGLSGPSDLQGINNKQDEVAVQAEHQALHSLEKLLERLSEGISFVTVLFEERVADIYERLEEDASQALAHLTYEQLFAGHEGQELAKTLVKAIVNRNIENGSNVETVADALRRRCGSFCSAEDVVIFKAQEQLKRATEQPLDSNMCRNLLYESLRLFEQVAGTIFFVVLHGAVDQYCDLRYYAGAIQLCLTVARERDRGNAALSWLRDGKPEDDARAQVYDEREGCYLLVYRVLQRLDKEAAKEPDVVDGRATLAATKRAEAYEVVNGSDDEVFHFGLYEWYVRQGLTDRLLAIESPHVITFLQKFAAEEVRYAELLCRFYTQRSQFFEAARVQANLVQSEFPLTLEERLALLSLAKANVNVQTNSVSRQERQMLDRTITTLLEVGNIQQDVLERLRVDARIEGDRRAEVEEELGYGILQITDLFNDYIDQAAYYDLALLAFHVAEYRNAPSIAQYWSNLIQQVHETAVARRDEAEDRLAAPHPYESVSAKIQEIAHKTGQDPIVFPINTLIPEVCRYSLDHHQDASIGADPTWPVQLFLAVGISHDMVTRVLEHVLDTQDYGFQGTAARTRLVEWIGFTVESWLRDVRRRGGASGVGVGVGGGVGVGSGVGVSGGRGGHGGGGGIGSGVQQLLERCENALPPAGHGNNAGGKDLADVRQGIKAVRRELAALHERDYTRSLRF